MEAEIKKNFEKKVQLKWIELLEQTISDAKSNKCCHSGLTVPSEFKTGIAVPFAVKWALLLVEAFYITIEESTREETKHLSMTLPNFIEKCVETRYKEGYQRWFSVDDWTTERSRGFVKAQDGTINQTGPDNNIYAQKYRNNPRLFSSSLKFHTDEMWKILPASTKAQLEAYKGKITSELFKASMRKAETVKEPPAEKKEYKRPSMRPSSAASSSSTPYAKPSANKTPAKAASVQVVEEYNGLWSVFSKKPQDHFEFKSPRDTRQESTDSRVVGWINNDEVMFAMPLPENQGRLSIGSYNKRTETGLLTRSKIWIRIFGSGKMDDELQLKPIGQGQDNEIMIIDWTDDASRERIRTRLISENLPEEVVSKLIDKSAVIRRPKLSNRAEEEKLSKNSEKRWYRWMQFKRLRTELRGMLETTEMGMAPHIYGLAVDVDEAIGQHQGQRIHFFQLVTVMERGNPLANQLKSIRNATTEHEQTHLIMQQLLSLVFSYSSCRIYVLDCKPDNLVVRQDNLQPLVIDMDSYFFRYAEPPAVSRLVEGTPFGDWKVTFFINMMVLSPMLKMAMNERDFRQMWWTNEVSRVMSSILSQAKQCQAGGEPGFCNLASALTDMLFVGVPRYGGFGRTAGSGTNAKDIKETTLEQTIHYTIVHPFDVVASRFATKFVKMLGQDKASETTQHTIRELKSYYRFAYERITPAANFFRSRLEHPQTRHQASLLPEVMLQYLNMTQDDLSKWIPPNLSTFDALLQRQENNVFKLTGFLWANVPR